MQVGDPKKAAILGVVALAALVFLATRFFDAPRPSPAAARTIPGLNHGEKQDVTALPANLRTDAFSHPALKQAGAGSQAQEPSGPQQRVDRPFEPWLGASPPQIQLPSAGLQAEIPQGSGQQSQQAPQRSRLTLHAVLRVRSMVAYLSVDGGEPRAFRVGDKIGNGATVVSVDEDAVELKLAKRRVRLEVGGEATL